MRNTGSGSFGTFPLRDRTRDSASPGPAARGETAPRRPFLNSHARSPWSNGLLPATPTDQMPLPL